MINGDRMICTFLNKKNAGECFTKWPLHLTIVPWFRIGLRTQAIEQDLSRKLSLFKPFEVSVQETALFGSNQDKPVNLVDSEDLIAIESIARKYLHSLEAWLVDESTSIQRPYRPHITHQESQRANQGESYLISQIAVVRKTETEKVVDGIIEL